MAGVYKHARGVLPPGARIGRFELVRRLAKGGMAELYLARALGIHGFEKLVVLKLVLAHLAEDRQFVDMFLGEARLAATLDHPNIVHVTDIGEVGGEPFFVMEYVHGQDLRSILRTCTKQKRKLPLPVALSIVAGAAAGLHYVHEKRDSEGKYLGLVHRDVSPSNVMLSYEGGVKLVDFGIAKATEIAQATRAGVLKGKVNYMAPEQCDGKPIDRRTDVFALGIMLYETTLNRRMFSGDNDFHVMSRIVRGVFAKPSELETHYPAQLEEIMLRCLATDPEDRYPTAQAVLKALEDFAHDQRVSLSTLVVADFLRDLYGEQPLPTADDGDDASPTALHPDARSAVRELVAARAANSAPDGATGVVPGRLEATGVVGPSESTRAGAATGIVPSGDATSVAVAGAPSRVPTALIDKTKRLPIEMTAIAPAPKPPSSAAGAIEATEPAPPLPPPSPSGPNLPASFEETDPLVPVPDRSRLWLGLAAVAVAVVGLAFVASNSGGDEPQTTPAGNTVQTVPAAAVPEATPSEPRSVAAPDPAPAATGSAPQPAVAKTEPTADASLDAEPPEPGDPRPEAADVATSGSPVDESTEDSTEVADDAQGEPPRRRRSSKRRRRGSSKKRRSSSSKGSQGLDAMYPGSK